MLPAVHPADDQLEQRGGVGAERLRRVLRPRPADLGQFARIDPQRNAGRRGSLEADELRALAIAGHLGAAGLAQAVELDAELLSDLAPHARRRVLAAPQATARKLPLVARAVGMADEQDLPRLAAHDALDPAGARAAEEPPHAQPGVRRAVCEPSGADRKRDAQRRFAASSWASAASAAGSGSSYRSTRKRWICSRDSPARARSYATILAPATSPLRAGAAGASSIAASAGSSPTSSSAAAAGTEPTVAPRALGATPAGAPGTTPPVTAAAAAAAASSSARRRSAPWCSD